MNNNHFLNTFSWPIAHVINKIQDLNMGYLELKSITKTCMHLKDNIKHTLV